MILFTRVEARDFHALFTRCVSGRPRGPAPVIVIRFTDGKRIIASTTTDGVILTHASPAVGERDDLLILPGAVLTEVEGSTDEGVKLERQSKLRGALDWHTGTKPHKFPVELIMPGKQHESEPLPVFTSVPGKLLLALHECGRSAAQDNGRYALSQIQVQGRLGYVIGTDSKIALLCGGFKFGFIDDILVPALTVFGAKPLSRVSELQVGRTTTHLVIVAGPWSVSLPFATKLRYPDVADIVPKHPTTVVGFDTQDAVALLKLLSTLPGINDENRPVTIDVNVSIKIRGRDPDTDETKEITLIRSSVAGPAVQVVIDRRMLARAIALGCHVLKLTPGKPVVMESDGMMFMAAPLDPAVLAESVAAPPKPPTEEPNVSPITIDPSRSRLMESPKTNGHTPPRGEPPDPLFVAEELRDALAEATTKAARLVATLKTGRKEKKVLASVFANLKQLGLDSGGPP